MFVAGERSGPGDDSAVFGVSAEESAVRAAGPAVGDHQSGRRDVAKAVGELCASHAGGEGAGQRSEAMGIGVGASGGEEKKTGSAEAGRGGGSAEAGGAAARVVGEWGRL